jgi:hypothetical protein
VNPLDLSLLQLVNGTLQDGTESQFLLCTASFQDEVITFGPDGIVIADLILGDAFLKNAYTSYASNLLCTFSCSALTLPLASTSGPRTARAIRVVRAGATSSYSH